MVLTIPAASATIAYNLQVLEEVRAVQSNQFFAEAKPRRLFFKVALPGMISMLAMSIYQVIEGIFIGHLLGEAAFAAINLAMPFVMINFSLADMMGVGSSVPISIALGEKDHPKANNYFTCSLFLILAASIFMGVILFFASPTLLYLLGAEGELAVLAIKYTRVFALLGPVTTLVFAMDNYLRISGFVKSSMALNIFMSILTAVLLWLFLGPAAMNVEGSALATCLAMTVCAVIAMIPFVRGKAVLKFVRPRLTMTMLREIVACGAPTFLNNIAGRVASIAMNTSLLRFGGQTAVAAYSVLMYAAGIVEPMLYGMTDSVSPAIGYNWGAKALERVRDIAKWALGACGVVSAAGAAMMAALAMPISRLFVNGADLELLEVSAHAMRLFSFAYLFRWFGFGMQSFFSAIEKPLPASVLSVCSAMIFPIFFIWLLRPLALDGLWLVQPAAALSVLAVAAIMVRRFQRSIAPSLKHT